MGSTHSASGSIGTATMFMFRRAAVACFSIALATAAAPCLAKPTREQIIASADRCKAEMKRLDLVAEYGTDFSALDLSGVDFRGHYAVGYEPNLRGADFSNCNLQGARFGAAVLDDANLTGANLEEATFITASLTRATLLRVRLKGTSFYQTRLSGARLTGADLSSANITGSDFAGADLSGATLSGAQSDYWWNDFSRANLTAAKLSGLKLNGANFRGATLRSADLSGAQLIQADFTEADLTETSLLDANVKSAVFRNAHGLADAELDRLEARAHRWKFESKAAVDRFIDGMYFPAYAAVVVALACLSFRVLRPPVRSRPVVVASFINLLAVLPTLVLLGLSLGGTSATVQFNAGSPSAMHMWSAWVGLWPPFMLALLACVVAALITFLMMLVSRVARPTTKRSKLALLYVGLTVAHCLFATHWVGRNFPSA